MEKLNPQLQRRVQEYIEQLLKLDDPRARGKGLTASHAGLWRFRIGDYRLIVDITRETFTILALRIDHRFTVYTTPPKR